MATVFLALGLRILCPSSKITRSHLIEKGPDLRGREVDFCENQSEDIDSYVLMTIYRNP